MLSMTPLTGYRDRSLRDYATARFAAIRLACGKGLISEADDKHEWEGSPVQKNDNRKNPIRSIRGGLNQRKPKTISGKPKNKVFKGFRPTLGYGFGLVWFFGLPEGF